VDRANGSNADQGTSWEEPVKDINTAMDLLYGGYDSKARGRKFLVLFRGRLTSGNAFTTEQVIDVSGVDVVGAGGLFGGGSRDSVFVTPPTTYGTYGCGLRIAKSDVRVIGLYFYNPDSVEAEHYHIFVDNDNQTANGVDILCNVFQGSDSNGDVTGRYTGGILTHGVEDFNFNFNKFYYIYRGIKLMAGSIRYTHKGTIEENRMYGVDKGVYAADAYLTETEIAGNRIIQKALYGYDLTGGIDMSGNPSGNLICENIVGHATESTAFVYGSGTNFWINNYHSGAGGTLANPDS
jgi:hypothetical protein